MARVRAVEGNEARPLTAGWQVGHAPAGAIADPAALAGASLDWCEATVPSTAASALRAAGKWSLDERRDFDAVDWWWKAALPAARGGTETRRFLRIGGLATIAEVWIDGQPVLSSRNMFVEHEVALEGALRDGREIVVCCRSLATALKARRPRPRWRTRLVEAQQLRWIRTALVGRIPTWAPAAAPVGPWRAVTVEDRTLASVASVDARLRVEGDAGIVDLEVVVDAFGPTPPQGISMHLGGAEAVALACVAGDRPGRVVGRGSARIEHAALWWPHTHGSPDRHALSLRIDVSGRSVAVDLGKVGFRRVEVDPSGDGFALRVNGEPVFCRGACWTTLDGVSFSGPPEAYRATLETVRAAGMNMVRVCGPFFYEDDPFYEACDDLGILVWQDYAFANMDYPGDDPDFVAEVQREARGFLDRTQTSAAIAVLCGNSEVEQQAAMMGAPREIWRSSLFGDTLAAASRAVRPDVPYWPSTPSGPGLPFVNDAGTANYFGVGAYLRPLEDARRAGVRFATECLAFANVPEQTLIDELLVSGGTPPQDPRWKARSPRDGATGWDFDDVRDHYLYDRFGVDPAALRYSEVARYLDMSRVVTGEVMAATFSEWRRVGSACGGALIWFLRDLCEGAGWGILDSRGEPKPAYHFVRRALQPLTVLLVDEGLNGLDAHVINDCPSSFEGDLEITAYRAEAAISTARTRLRVGARSSERVRPSALLEHFIDSTHAYRFGAPAQDVTVATLVEASTGAVRGEAFHFPRKLPSQLEHDLGLEATATQVDGDVWEATLRSKRLAFAVELSLRDFRPDDNYFHLAPGRPRTTRVRATRPGARPQGSARPLNAHTAVKVEIKA